MIFFLILALVVDLVLKADLKSTLSKADERPSHYYDA